MKFIYGGIGALAVAMLIGGCKPKEAVGNSADRTALVPQGDRSAHFDAVNRRLELGGTLYGYVDVDGDLLKFAGSARKGIEAVAVDQPQLAPLLKQDFAQLASDLGLNDIRAIGLSSVADKTGGFRNRVFLYTPDGRRGLLAGLGGAPTAFNNARLAPADADVYAESDIDVPAIYAAIKALVAKVGGAEAATRFEAELTQDQTGLGLTPLAVIQSLKGRATIILRTDPERTVTLPGDEPVTIPAFQFLIRVEGLGTPLAGPLAKVPLFKAAKEGALSVFTLAMPLPVEGLQPQLAIDGATLYIASSPEFLHTALAQKAGLDQTPAFKAALAELGAEGNGVAYISPRFFTQLRRVKSLNPNVPPQIARVLDLVFNALPEINAPLVSVRTNLPDGVLFRSHWNRSLKQDLALVTVSNPMTIGVLAAMAIPAFQKVRTASQEKTIYNNLRQLDAAANQYMLENGVNEARYDQLIGNDKYIRELKPIVGEDYTHIVIRSTDREIVVTTVAGKTVRLAR